MIESTSVRRTALEERVVAEHVDEAADAPVRQRAGKERGEREDDEQGAGEQRQAEQQAGADPGGIRRGRVAQPAARRRPGRLDQSCASHSP